MPRWCIVLALNIFLFSCSSKKPSQQEEIKESPISGTLILYADESFKPIIEAERLTFEGLYDKATIDTVYTSELKTWNSFLQGKCDMIVVGRDLNNKEKEYFKSATISITSSYFARDAVALVVNKSFPDSVISFTAFQDLLNGKITTWDKVKKGLPATAVQLVTDQSNSANLFLLKDNVGFQSASVKVEAAGTNSKVFDYVQQHPWSIGIVSFELLSDTDAMNVKKLLNRVKLLGIQKNVSEFSQSVFPAQATMKEYPLARKIFVIVKNTKVGLATGFTSFLMSERGQRIVLKSGILPAKMPGREIEIKNN